jgi:hypothetical protein
MGGPVEKWMSRLWFGIWFVIWEYWKRKSAYFVSEKEVIILYPQVFNAFSYSVLAQPSTVVNVSSERILLSPLIYK